jgi:hypothetical protein
VTQVASETMEQFQTKFNHISMNSHLSAQFKNIDDLDYFPKRTLLNEDYDNE